MVLVRVWRRQLYGGMGAALIVPGMVLASLAVLALAGGFAGLTALGQAFSGPSTPAAVTSIGHLGTSARPLPAAIVAALSAVPAHTGPTIVVSSRSPSGGARTAPRASSPTGPRVPGHSGTHGHPRPPGHGGRPQGPKPQPTLIDGIVNAGTAVTSQAPSPAGPAATSALQTAGSTLDSIAPIKGP